VLKASSPAFQTSSRVRYRNTLQNCVLRANHRHRPASPAVRFQFHRQTHEATLGLNWYQLRASLRRLQYDSLFPSIFPGFWCRRKLHIRPRTWSNLPSAPLACPPRARKRCGAALPTALHVRCRDSPRPRTSRSVVECGGCDAAFVRRTGYRISPAPHSHVLRALESGVALRFPPHSKTLPRLPTPPNCAKRTWSAAAVTPLSRLPRPAESSRGLEHSKTPPQLRPRLRLLPPKGGLAGDLCRKRRMHSHSLAIYLRAKRLFVDNEGFGDC